MFRFGTRSNQRLLTVCMDLQLVANAVMDLQVYDFTIVTGWRSEEEQMQAYLTGVSEKKWPDSKHNKMVQDIPLSDALDFAPWCILPSGKWGIPWNDTYAFAILGGMFISIGVSLGVQIRYGGDWDMDGLTTDQLLMDWGHVEVVRT